MLQILQCWVSVVFHLICQCCFDWRFYKGGGLILGIFFLSKLCWKKSICFLLSLVYHSSLVFLKNSNILSWMPTFCSGLCSLGTRLKWNQFLESKLVQWNHRQEATVFFPKCIFIDTDGTREWHIFKCILISKRQKHFTTQKLKWRIWYKIASSCMYDNLRLSYYVIL